MNTKPVIRPADITEAESIANLYLRSRAWALPSVPVAHEPDDVRRWFRDYLLPKTDTFVAVQDGTIVGFMSLDDHWIEQLYLEPGITGQGIGTQLLELAKLRFPTGLKLWTFQVNDRAREFYEKHGFVVSEMTDGAGNEEHAPDVLYKWGY